MGKSYRDKNAHKARNPEKYFDGDLPRIHMGSRFESVDWGEVLFKEGVYPNKDFPGVAWSIQGKRRRNTTRKSNQKAKQMNHQINRAKEKSELQRQLKSFGNE